MCITLHSLDPNMMILEHVRMEALLSLDQVPEYLSTHEQSPLRIHTVDGVWEENTLLVI